MTDWLEEIEARVNRDDGRSAMAAEATIPGDMLREDVADRRRLIARVREQEAQAAIGRLAQEYVKAIDAENEVGTLGLDQEAFEAEWDKRWDVADAAYERLVEKCAALAALDGERKEGE